MTPPPSPEVPPGGDDRGAGEGAGGERVGDDLTWEERAEQVRPSGRPEWLRRLARVPGLGLVAVPLERRWLSAPEPDEEPEP